MMGKSPHPAFGGKDLAAQDYIWLETTHTCTHNGKSQHTSLLDCDEEMRLVLIARGTITLKTLGACDQYDSVYTIKPEYLLRLLISSTLSITIL